MQKMAFYKKDGLVIFTIDKISTKLKNDKEVKCYEGLPAWSNINSDNMKEYIKPNYKAIGIITGKMSNITVVDFDSVEVYDIFVNKYPDLKKCVTVKTRRGYHLYFNYYENVKSTTNVFKLYDGVDIRNDGAFITGPQSSYRTLDGTKHKYKYLFGEFLDFPDYLINELKPEVKKDNNIIYNIPVTENKNNFDEINKLISLLDDNRADDFTEWRNIGFIINNELGKEGYVIFDEFSQRSKKYNKMDVFKFYSSIKKKDSGLKLASLKRMAKIDNPEKYKEIIKINNEYENIKEEFELTHFKIINPIAYGCLYDNNLVIKTRKEMNDTYENKIYETKNKDDGTQQNSFINNWFKDPNIKTYDKVDFRPCQKLDNMIYNTFDGFEVEKKQLYNIDITETRLYEHLFNLSGRDEKSLNWFLNCLSNMVQQPYKRTTTSLILKSVQGCGKDTFFDYFGNKILGSQYYINDSKTDLFFGRFNSAIERKILVVINETNQASTKDIINNLKDAVTKEKNKIEHKGLKVREEQNNIFYVFLTNNKNPLPIEETDRRFCAIECNGEIAQNSDYFIPLYQELESGKIDKAFYDFLMRRNISNYNFSEERPITQLYKNMKQRNAPPLARFLCEIVDKEKTEYGAMIFFNMFDYFLSENKIDFKVSNTSFGIDIKDYKGIEKARTTKGAEYKIDTKILKDFLIKKGFYEELPFSE
jgi:hypothetical protein